MDSIKFKTLQGWIDYDQPYLTKLNKKQKVEYLEKRIDLVLLKPLEEMLESLLMAKPNSSSLLCIATCVCCSIEAMSKFYTGKTDRRNSGARFKEYVQIFMHKDYFSQKIGNDKYVDLLRDNFRNGLAHGFTIKKGGFEHATSYFKNKSGNLYIDPQLFYDDFNKSIKKYLGQVKRAKKKSLLFINFDKAFVDIFINGI